MTQIKGTYACCQLLTAFNAWSFLHWKPSPILPGSPELEIFVDLVGCRYGSAFEMWMPKAWKCLGLNVQEGPVNLSWIRYRLSEGRPVEIGAAHPTRGLHSALVVNIEDNLLSIVNWNKETVISTIYWKDLEFIRNLTRPIAAYSLV